MTSCCGLEKKNIFRLFDVLKFSFSAGLSGARGREVGVQFFRLHPRVLVQVPTKIEFTHIRIQIEQPMKNVHPQALIFHKFHFCIKIISNLLAKSS